MSACGLQDTPRDVLSFFHPTPRRRRQPEKVDNHHARNYTLKLPLSLIITMHYAAARNCRKRAFPGLPNECRGRLGGVRPGPAKPPLPPGAGPSCFPAKELRNHPGRPCLRRTRRNEVEGLQSQAIFARACRL